MVNIFNSFIGGFLSNICTFLLSEPVCYLMAMFILCFIIYALKLFIKF